MRTLTMAAMLAVTLILAAGGVVAGQATGATDPLASGSVTIDIEDVDLITPAVLVPDAQRMVYHADGRAMAMTWASSDPRLSGSVACTGHLHLNRDGSSVESEVFLLVNEDGSWSGTSTGLAVAHAAPDLVIGNGLLPEVLGHRDLILLEGAGSYEGLSALVQIDWTQQPLVADGAIFRGALPATPELAVVQ